MKQTKPVNERIILDLCGGTGAWSRPYAEAGYDVRLVTGNRCMRGCCPETAEDLWGFSCSALSSFFCKWCTILESKGWRWPNKRSNKHSTRLFGHNRIYHTDFLGFRKSGWENGPSYGTSFSGFRAAQRRLTSIFF